MHHAGARAIFAHFRKPKNCDINRDSTPQTLNSQTIFCDVNRRSALRDAHFSKFVYLFEPQKHKPCTVQRRERNSCHLNAPRCPLECGALRAFPPHWLKQNKRFGMHPRRADGTLRPATVPPESLRRAEAAATFPQKARTAQGRQRWLK